MALTGADGRLQHPLRGDAMQVGRHLHPLLQERVNVFFNSFTIKIVVDDKRKHVQQYKKDGINGFFRGLIKICVGCLIDQFSFVRYILSIVSIVIKHPTKENVSTLRQANCFTR